LMTPEKRTIRVAIVLGERAVALALASGIPESIKTLIKEARPYAEGRGIRFPVSSAADVPVFLTSSRSRPRRNDGASSHRFSSRSSRFAMNLPEAPASVLAETPALIPNQSKMQAGACRGHIAKQHLRA